MFKKFSLAAAFVLASIPAFVSAQDIIFWSFDEFSRVATTSVAPGTTSATAYIFADASLDINQLDIDFSTSDPNVAVFTGGRVFNPGAANSGMSDSTSGGAFTSVDLLEPNGPGPITPTDGRLLATCFLCPGSGLDNSSFRAGANGNLLAEVDFDIVGEGTANFDFVLGALGVVNDGVGDVPVTLQGGTLTVGAVPEPSSAVLMILGAAAMVARRRRL